MRRTLIIAGLLFAPFRSHAGEPQYVHEVARWQEIDAPVESNRSAWTGAANFSGLNWRVFVKKGEVRAQLDKEEG
jgi:hypothetical protein